MGLSGSKLGSIPDDSNERYFGLENFGNTCYCNSVLQALYFCEPFREHAIKHASSSSSSSLSSSNGDDETLLQCLGDLYSKIASQKKRTGVYAPRKFVNKLRKDNELFRGFMHQDAHEFLNYVLNVVADLLANEARKSAASARTNGSPSGSGGSAGGSAGSSSASSSASGSLKRDGGASSSVPSSSALSSASSVPSGGGLASSGSASGGGVSASGVASGASRRASASPTPTSSHPSSQPTTSRPTSSPPPTWIHSLFEGTLTNETRCLTCERISNRDESFFDLSVDISQNSSVSACLKNFSASEMMCHRDKFYCDACGSLQEAEKRLKVKRPPKVLALHLKRFKYIDTSFKKLSYRVAFPFELRLFNTTEEEEYDPERLYELFAVVIHIGSGPNQGHYIAIIKSAGQWLVFDDENVEAIDERVIQSFFGSTQEMAGTNESGYILFYQSVTRTGSDHVSVHAEEKPKKEK